MGIGVSVFLLAIGAILAFAVNVQSNGIDLNTVGVILMICGGIGLFASLVFFEGMFGDWGYGRRRTVVRDRDDLADVAPRRVVRERRVVRDEDIV